MKGASWCLVQSNKFITTMPAHLQGLATNLAHYADSRVVEDGHPHSPLVWANGARIDFHDAVRLFCPPAFLQQFRNTPNCHEILEESTCTSVGDHDNSLPSASSSHTPRIYDQTARVDHQIVSTISHLSSFGEVHTTKLSNSLCHNGMFPKVPQDMKDPPPTASQSTRDSTAPGTNNFPQKTSDV